MNARRVTFLLPGDNRSGGVRVTAVMGNMLLARGWDVRIAHRRPGRLTVRGLAETATRAVRTVVPGREEGWLHVFRGRVERYADVNGLSFAPQEVVIAVGTYMVPDVVAIRAGVTKVRFNHGFPAEMSDDFRAAWSIPMTTITVSRTMVSRLEAMSGGKVAAVVPNGIDRAEYFEVPGVRRDAVGTIYSSHPNKAPADIVRLVNRVGEAMPAVPRLLFSTEPRPDGLAGASYEMYPPIARAREIYSRSVAWLLASTTEGLPGPVLEAMACGAVVVSTDNEGSLEVIEDGVNGLIVPRGDIEAFLPKIRALFEDDALRRRLAAGGFETAKRFSWDVAAERMDAFLRGVAGG
jgi:glycosyltransferase involved in cell wall biosynthesis